MENYIDPDACPLEDEVETRPELNPDMTPLGNAETDPFMDPDQTPFDDGQEGEIRAAFDRLSPNREEAELEGVNFRRTKEALEVKWPGGEWKDIRTMTPVDHRFIVGILRRARKSLDGSKGQGNLRS